MYEKVNKYHPDKVADRIAGALVDIAYKQEDNPKIAVEVLIGHGVCHIIAETSCKLPIDEVYNAVKRIGGDVEVDYKEVPQDKHLADNQSSGFRCGDNGIFKGVPITKEQNMLCKISRVLEDKFNCDGKYILDVLGERLIVCQSNANKDDMFYEINKNACKLTFPFEINPIGDWTGGTDVDTGATNRKLGSDMGDAVTGGGLHGKELSKADVSVNIYCHLQAQRLGKTVCANCAIGDEYVNIFGAYGDMSYKVPFAEIVEVARIYIKGLGGFEKFAEYGLIR